jgi:hypothetical protein
VTTRSIDAWLGRCACAGSLHAPVVAFVGGHVGDVGHPAELASQLAQRWTGAPGVM